MEDNYVNWIVKDEGQKIELKEKDLELVGLMNTNARIQLSELSKKMKLSKVAVFNRIKNLEKKGIITGYSCFVDFFKLGFKTYQIGIKTGMTIKEKGEYVDRIKDLDFMNQILRLSGGRWDFLIRIVSNEDRLGGDLDELSDLNIQGMDILQIRKMSFLNKHKVQNVETRQGVENLSAKEMKLLIELTQNSRQKIVDLSAKLEATPKTVIDMIKRLQKKRVVLSLITEFNPFIYGNDAYLFVITTKNRKIEEKIVENLIKNNSTGALLNFQNPNILSFHVVSSLQDLKKVEKVLEPYLDEVLSHEFIKVEEQTMYSFFPKVLSSL